SAKATPSNRLRFRQSTYVAQPPSFLRLSLFSTLAPLAGRLAKACLAVRNPFVPHSLQPPASRLAAGAFSCVSPPHNPDRRQHLDFKSKVSWKRTPFPPTFILT